MKTRASALLLSIFMMSMLILVSISVSVLVIRDVRTVRTIVEGTQSYYAAEGMSELGLEAKNENLPGYEPSFLDYALSSSVTADLTTQARGAVVPCAGQSASGWSVLSPNESIQLALFAQSNDAGDILKNTSFQLDFYVGDESGATLFDDLTGYLTDREVLRWKILGLSGDQTEAISEYIGLDTTANRTSESNPSMFGPDVTGVPDEYLYASYYSSGFPSRHDPAYHIDTFLQDHNYNYLVLTNIIQGVDDAYIYYRLNWVNGGDPLAELDEVVCEYTELSSLADSASGDVRKLLTTLVREGENLPVFDFVLYHTEDDEAASTP